MLDRPETTAELLARLREDPEVQKRAALFDKRRKRRGLAFFEILERFAGPPFRSAKDIADEAGVARDLMRRFYNAHAIELLGVETSCRLRRRNSTREKWRLQAAWSATAAPAVARARAAGCTVEPALTSEGRALKEVAVINSCVCRIRRLTGARAYGDTLLYRCSTTVRLAELQKAAFLIFHLQVEGRSERFFVISSGALKRKLFTGRSRTHASFYLPLEKPATVDGLDIWARENAWSSIKSRQMSNAAS
jgi:hypothetical protein